MSFTYSFENLEAWKKARVVVKKTYQLTNTFSVDERFGLKSQMNRSAVSIASNLAEGSGRSSQKEKGRYYIMAQSSAYELVNQLILCNDLGFCNPESYQQLRRDIEVTTFMIFKLIKSTGYSIVQEPEMDYFIDEDLDE